jgi:chorismate mutase
VSAVFDDPERYEHDGFYEEDTDYEDEYETDDFDYIVDDEEDENALWDDEEEAADDLPEKKRRKRKNQVVLADNDTDTEETELSEQAMWQIAKEEQLIEELEADAEEHPFEDGTDEGEPERKKLKRELRAEALARLEDSARTQREFENVIAWWDRLDANRERRERYHELSRSGDDVPLDYGASANELFFPDMLNDVLEKQLRKGDFIDAIFYCPYDIHELVTEEYLSKILWELNEEHKELLFLCAVRLFSSTRIAKIRNQSDRNIRKVRGTMLKKIRKKLLPALLDKAEKQQPMTLLEKDFLEESGMEIDSGEKK